MLKFIEYISVQYKIINLRYPNITLNMKIYINTYCFSNSGIGPTSWILPHGIGTKKKNYPFLSFKNKLGGGGGTRGRKRL